MTARDQLKKETAKAARERHQKEFRLIWRAVSEHMPLHEEVKFTSESGWRFDFAHTVAKVGIEIQGGIWREKGAHNTGEAILRDTRKARAAALEGWVLFPICPEDINLPNLCRIRDFVRTRAVQLADPYKEAR